MTSTLDVTAYLDSLLGTASIPDYSNALNGLQFENDGTITKAAASVDFSSRVVNLAIEQRADFLILHHGMFWNGLKPVTGSVYSRMRALIENNIAVYSSHLPLDKHGNPTSVFIFERNQQCCPLGFQKPDCSKHITCPN